MSPLPFILCADDFGLSPRVSDGVLELARKRRLSAVSCMMTQSGLRESAEELKSHANHLDIGVHLVLTDLKALSASLGQLPSIGALTRKTLMGGLSKSDIRSELTRQLEAFAGIFGRDPDFIDSHHHVHQLPGITEIVLDLVEKCFISHSPYIRSCGERPSLLLRRGVAPFKAAALSIFGMGLKRRAEARKIPVNDGFSGVYDLTRKVPYGKLFDRFTDGLRSGSLIMCHPGNVELKVIAVTISWEKRRRPPPVENRRHPQSARIKIGEWKPFNGFNRVCRTQLQSSCTPTRILKN